MGMGEPLLNLDNVLEACERLPDLGIATSNTAISTVGWIPGIERLAREGRPVRLALSLHAPEEALRSELMPVNDRYPLDEVLAACRDWHAARKREVFVEYLMLNGVNDRVEQAHALADLLREPRNAFKVNLIPYNPTEAGFEGSTPRRHRSLPEHAGEARPARDGAPHPRPRHRRGLRSAGRDALVRADHVTHR